MGRRTGAVAVAVLVLMGGLLALRGQRSLREGGPAPAAPRLPPVVVDPAHGGIDGGAVHGRMLEKDVNLDVGLRLAEALRRRGFPVELTRERDEHLSLRSYREDLPLRLDTAARHGAWALVAIHVNAAAHPDARGALVLYQEREPRSRLLARLLREELEREAPDRPNLADVERDHYYFDRSPVPTVAVELGYITSPEDRRLLRSPAFRQRLAEAVARGLARAWSTGLFGPVGEHGGGRPGRRAFGGRWGQDLSRAYTAFLLYMAPLYKLL